MNVCVCAFTFSLGGHFERCRALSLAVAIVGHNPEAIFGVWHEVLDGDLHLPRTAGIHYSLPDVETHTFSSLTIFILHSSVRYTCVQSLEHLDNRHNKCAYLQPDARCVGVIIDSCFDLFLINR